MELSNFWRDIRFGARMLLKSPAFTGVAVLTLALGIGANTAIFSVIDAALLRPLPYPDADRIVVLYQLDQDKQTDNPAPADFLEFQRESKSFEQLAAYRGLPANLSGNGQPERVQSAIVTSGFFAALGVPALHGRTILPELDAPGGSGVAVLSYGLWQRRFGGNPEIVGRPIEIDGEARTVAGIMPQGFAFPSGTELWMASRFAAPPHPLRLNEDPAAVRDSHYFESFGRLKSGVTPMQASAEVDTIAKRIKQQYGADEFPGATVIPLRQDLVGETRPALLILLGAVSLVLLIACVNVANIILARGASRQKEMALRIALGAGRSHLLRQLLSESLLLAVAGGALGILLAVWGLPPLRALVPVDMVGGAPITLDSRVLLFTLLASLTSGVLFGLIPGLRLLGTDLNATLQEGGRGSAGGGRAGRMRSVLVVTEIAMAAVLLIAAGLLLRSFSQLLRVHEGFNPEQLLSMQLALPQGRYAKPGDRVAFVKNTLEKIDALPGIGMAAVVSRLPLNPGNSSRSLEIEGRTAAPSGDIAPDYLVVTPAYFQTLGVPLRNGRTFSERDDAQAAPVAIISEATARHFWPNEEAVGKHLRGACGDEKTWCQVVGVVGDIKQHHLEQAPKLAVYVPFAQDPWTFFALVVRTNLEPTSAAAGIVGVIHGVDPDEPVYNVRPMRDVEAASLSPQRLQIALIGLFAALALVLACMGIYGVMAYSVAQRTSEMGVRMALGAQAGNVMAMVLGEGMRLAVLGAGIGLAGSFFVAKLLSGMLFGITATDPLTFGGVAVVLVLVAMVACCVPAWRATRVDPLVALRHE
jgi:predicted permease